MKKGNWVLINPENVKPYICDETYSSKLLTGDELTGSPLININEGTLKAGCRTSGDAHEETEIYYIVRCEEGCSSVWLDDEEVLCKPHDLIVIPPHVFHWIDNTKSSKPFVLMTFWPRQEQNGVYHARLAAWGKSMIQEDENYEANRIVGKGDE
jgi:mannose-6-phosphate isomerase-like protein (cupin superfamily)